MLLPWVLCSRLWTLRPTLMAQCLHQTPNQAGKLSLSLSRLGQGAALVIVRLFVTSAGCTLRPLVLRALPCTSQFQGESAYGFEHCDMPSSEVSCCFLRVKP